VSRDADEIRQEIDETREELGETLEAIGARVAPGHVAEQVREDVDEKLDKVSPARILRRRTEGLRSTVARMTEAGAGEGTLDGAVGDRVRAVCDVAAREVRSAPPSAQALAAFGAGLAATAILPSFARRRFVALLVGGAGAAAAISR
jgi:hypothetical protein